MTELNRRNMLGAAGATMALVACGGKDAGGGGSTGDAEQICIDLPTGERAAEALGKYPDNKLANPDPVGKQKPIKYKGKDGFKPQNDYLAYIKFENGKIKIRTAYFAVTPAGASENLALIATRFQQFAKGQLPDGALAPAENFDYFGFGSQTRLYFFLDNGSDVTFDPDNKIRMAMYQAGDKGKKLLPKDNSFWNIQIRDEILSAENWYAKENGDVIPDASGGDLPNGAVDFSMNIHVLMNVAGSSPAKFMPIIIDPDGTNGIRKP
jgi:hypothetical protein